MHLIWSGQSTAHPFGPQPAPLRSGGANEERGHGGAERKRERERERERGRERETDRERERERALSDASETAQPISTAVMQSTGHGGPQRSPQG